MADPRDAGAFAAAVLRPLADPVLAAGYGAAAHDRAYQLFLADRHLSQWARLIRPRVGGAAGPETSGQPGGPGSRSLVGNRGAARAGAGTAPAGDAVVLPLQPRPG